MNVDTRHKGGFNLLLFKFQMHQGAVAKYMTGSRIRLQKYTNLMYYF
jgi:hypothetical protein